MALMIICNVAVSLSNDFSEYKTVRVRCELCSGVAAINNGCGLRYDTKHNVRSQSSPSGGDTTTGKIGSLCSSEPWSAACCQIKFNCGFFKTTEYSTTKLGCVDIQMLGEEV